MLNHNYPLYEIKSVNNLQELINYAVEQYGDKPVFAFERNNETIHVNCNQFKEDIGALGEALLDLGVTGTRIAAIGENSYEWILTYFAAVNYGNIIVPIDKELPAANIKNIVDNSNTKVFVYSESFSDIAKYLQEKGAGINHYISMNLFPELINRGKSIIPKGISGVSCYRLDNSKLAVILYTSGTTGDAKGVMLSHKNLACNAVSTCSYVLLGDSLAMLPLHHSFAFTCCILCMLLKGHSIAINNSLKHLQSDLIKYQPQCVFMVPLLVETFCKQILAKAGKDSSDNNLLKISREIFGGNLSVIFCGGAAIDSKYPAIYRKFGINLLVGYGITECSPVVSVNRNEYYRDGSIGLALPCCEVKILEPEENGHGEICVKGENVMLGYYKDEQSTKESYDGDWFKTGDIGYIDDDGFLFISGRKKNVIILNNGKNVYPEEIELSLLNKIPYIKEAIVYEEERMIVAEVYLDTDNIPNCATQLDNDIGMLNRTLPPYSNIGKTVIRDIAFPKTASKKIIRDIKKGGNDNA